LKRKQELKLKDKLRKRENEMKKLSERQKKKG